MTDHTVNEIYNRIGDLYTKVNDLCDRMTKMETRLDAFFRNQQSSREKVSYAIAAASTAIALFTFILSR